MKEVLNNIIKFITSKRVKKVFAREFLILFFGIILASIYSLYTESLDPECWRLNPYSVGNSKKDLSAEIYEQCLNSKDYIKYNNLKSFEESYYFILIFLFYGARILYQFFRFVRWCFRIVFFDK